MIVNMRLDEKNKQKQNQNWGFSWKDITMNIQLVISYMNVFLQIYIYYNMFIDLHSWVKAIKQGFQ